MYGDALTTKARIKERLQITATTFDTFLDNTILAVTKRISQACGRRFTQATFTNELHDGSELMGTRRSVLVLKNSPIGTISSVQYDDGTNSTADWTDFDADDYRLDETQGLLYFTNYLPAGKQNIRVTYTGGYSGYSIGVMNYWTFNIIPTGTVDGSNLTFTLPEDATQVIVYADGIRVLATNYSFTAGAATFTFVAGQAPYSSIAVDYVPEIASADSEQWLPSDLVEVAEVACVRIFKRRDAEGRTSEGFGESQVTWREDVFTKEDRATISNYRRGYNL